MDWNCRIIFTGLHTTVTPTSDLSTDPFPFPGGFKFHFFEAEHVGVQISRLLVHDLAVFARFAGGHSLAKHNLVSKKLRTKFALVSMSGGNLLLLLTQLKQMKVLKFR
jgi:hypothetical protein